MSMNAWEKFKNIYLVDLLESFSIAMAITVILYYVFFTPNIVDGSSMEPNFHDKEFLVTDITIQWFGGLTKDQFHYDYKRGDIVIFKALNMELIKRVVGLPGDKVKISSGHVYINGELFKEDYLSPTTLTDMPFRYQSTFKEDEEVTVPQNKYFLMGDNRMYSEDSRYSDVGFIDRDNIKGRVILRIYPFTYFAQK